MQVSPLYAAIDLHSNNSVLSILDDSDRVVYERRLKNRLDEILAALAPYRERVTAVAVESTFNWYWLVDGLIEADYEARLVNTAAVQQYDGLKYSDDRYDARWLAHLMRLGILPVGYIMPKEQRATRDLLRKRLQLVHQRTANILSLENLKQRNEGVRLTVNDLRNLTAEALTHDEPNAHRAMALRTTLEVIVALGEHIDKLESAILKTLRPDPTWQHLRTIWGVGPILAMTIVLETGPITRFGSPGDYASYCRCVRSQRISNGKSKGKGNDKCGNRYLAWAWMEAANFAIRSYPAAKRFYERKAAATNTILARKALAHKLARAGWHVMKTATPFKPSRLFG
jgi:transposase